MALTVLPDYSELCIYLNKPVLAFWREACDGFNSGTPKVTVTQIDKK